MSYVKTTWSNGATALSAENMNHIENGIEALDAGITEGLAALEASKVDKVTGKGLSTNDYTTNEKNKLAGIATGAEVNQNAFAIVKVGSSTIIADSKIDTLTLAAGSNVTLTTDTANDKVTIAATNTTYSDATTSAHGLMSASDKAKVDKIPTEFYMGSIVFSGTSTTTPTIIDTNLIGKSRIVLTGQDVEAAILKVEWTDRSGMATTNGKVKVTLDRAVDSIRFNYIAW